MYSLGHVSFRLIEPSESNQTMNLIKLFLVYVLTVVSSFILNILFYIGVGLVLVGGKTENVSNVLASVFSNTLIVLLLLAMFIATFGAIFAVLCEKFTNFFVPPFPGRLKK